MKHYYYFLSLFFFMVLTASAQEEVVNPRPLTIEEYEKAKTFTIEDMDNQSYVKVDNKYVLDRFEMRKPYYITGDDGLKKRIDLYKLISKEDMTELGLMIFYTNEKGKKFVACMPNFTAEGKVWETYFNDIHAINKVEENYILKLSYILSKEVSFQLFKALNHGMDLTAESVTYGNDICFPGDQFITLAGGSKKLLKDVVRGDEILITDDVSGTETLTTVTELVVHEPKNYAITKLTLLSADERITESFNEVFLSTKTIKATPNHPIATSRGNRTMGSVETGETLLCYNSSSSIYEKYVVIDHEEISEGIQPVYNINTTEGNTFIMNDIIVLTK